MRNKEKMVMKLSIW